jgi:uncharacterized protein YqgV (UPF0045/DUF77 family)
MKVTVEISLYPLHAQYTQAVLDFIERLRSHPSIQVETNGLSTQVFGDYELVMSKILPEEIKKVFEDQHAVVVMKLGKGILRYQPDPEKQ